MVQPTARWITIVYNMYSTYNAAAVPREVTSRFALMRHSSRPRAVTLMTVCQPSSVLRSAGSTFRLARELVAEKNRRVHIAVHRLSYTIHRGNPRGPSRARTLN